MTLRTLNLDHGPLTGPANAVRPSLGRWSLDFLIVSCLFTGHIGLAVVPGFSLQLPLLALYLCVASFAIEGSLRLRTLPAVMYGIIVSAVILSIVAGFSEYYSVASAVYLAIIYLPIVFEFRRDSEESPWLINYALSRFVICAVVLAGLAVIQFVGQIAFKPSWWFNFSLLLPAEIRTIGIFNSEIPIAGGLFKANAFLQREPSGLSLVLAVAVLIELLHFRRYKYVLPLAIGMLVSYSGSGIILLAIGLLFPRQVSAIPRALILFLVGWVLWTFFADALGLGVFAGRLGEFGMQGSSGYARFNAPRLVLEAGWRDAAGSFWFGHGPGTIFRAIQGFTAAFEIHDPTWAKVLYEYGAVGAAAFGLFWLAVFQQRRVPLEFIVAIFYGWLASGGQLLSPTYISLMFVTVSFWGLSASSARFKGRGMARPAQSRFGQPAGRPARTDGLKASS